MDSDYRIQTTAWKATVAGIAIAVIPATVDFLATQEFPQSREAWTLLGAGFVGAVMRGFWNWWKHGGDRVFASAIEQLKGR